MSVGEGGVSPPYLLRPRSPIRSRLASATSLQLAVSPGGAAKPLPAPYLRSDPLDAAIVRNYPTIRSSSFSPHLAEMSQALSAMPCKRRRRRAAHYDRSRDSPLTRWTSILPAARAGSHVASRARPCPPASPLHTRMRATRLFPTSQCYSKARIAFGLPPRSETEPALQPQPMSILLSGRPCLHDPPLCPAETPEGGSLPR